MSNPEHLYRTVQREELLDLAACRAFRTAPGSIEGKLFWTTREDAERLARLFSARHGIGPSWIVEVVIEQVELERMNSLTTDGRPARYVDEANLDWFNDIVDMVLPADFDGQSIG
ncbi:MAG: hypothetical protein ABSG43_30770 [Solirubrobacteraceae bacterium]